MRRIVAKKDFVQPNRAERTRQACCEFAIFAGNKLGAAPAHIDNENPFFQLGPAALNAKMDEPCLLLSRYDFDRSAQCAACFFQELRLIASVADRAGRDSAYSENIQF